MNLRLGLSAWFVLLAAGLVPCGCSDKPPSQPPKARAEPSEVLRRLAPFTPAQAVAVGYFPGDVVQAEMDNLLGDGFADWPEGQRIVRQVRPILRQVGSISTVKMPPDSMPFDTLVLLQMPEGIQPAWQAVQALAGQNAERLRPVGPGRYELDLPEAGLRIGIVRGDQTEQMADDLVLICDAQILGRFPLDQPEPDMEEFRDLLGELPANVRYWQVLNIDIPQLGGPVQMISYSREVARQRGTVRFPTKTTAIKARALVSKYVGNREILEAAPLQRLPESRKLAADVLAGLVLNWQGRSVDYGLRIPRGFIPRTVAALQEVRNLARDVVSKTNLRQLAQATMLYRQDHESKMPEELKQLIPYLGDTQALFATEPARRAGIDRRGRLVGRPDYRLVNPPLDWNGREILLLDQPWVQVGDDRMNVVSPDGQAFDLSRQEYERLLEVLEARQRPRQGR